MLVTILIPMAWLNALGLSSHLHEDPTEAGHAGKAALLHALTQPMDGILERLQLPMEVEQGRSQRVSINIPSAPGNLLQFVANSLGLTPGPTAKRLIGLVARGDISSPSVDGEEAVAADHPLSILNRQMGLSPRVAQAMLYDNIWDSLSSGRVGLVEGDTGIGKTRVMMAAAVRWVRERQSSIGICAPSITLLRQQVEEYKSQQAVDSSLPALRLFIGRREFVSEVELRNFLETGGSAWDTPAVRDWLVNGCGPHDRQNVLDTSWQVHSLLQIAPDIPVDEVRVSDINETTDRGFVAYRRQFDDKSSDPDRATPSPAILVFTHAMLAQDMRRKLILAGQDETYTTMQAFFIQALRSVKGKKMSVATDDFDAIAVLESELGVALNTAAYGRSILPSFLALMVDEGHMLEESMSSSLSAYVSIRSLLHDLRAFKALGGKVSAESLGVVENALQALIIEAPKLDRRDFVALSGDGEGRLTSHLSAIATVCASISQVRDAESQKFRLSLKIRRAGVLIDSAVNRNRNQSFMRHSPIKQLPLLMISNAHVQTVLSRLWSSLESAAIVSATLYVPTTDGPSGTFMASLLQIQLSRSKSYIPVTAKWNAHCVKGVWIAQSSTQWLYPPTAATQGKRSAAEIEMSESRWHQDLGTEVAKIWKTAAGGVLVLCTSYATVEAIYGLLASDEDIAPGLVRAVSNISVGSQAAEFMMHSHAGKKPLWLGVGSAWTGVDIGGHSPWQQLFGEPLSAEMDNVLTDLVVPRLPFRTNQSLSHLWRMRNNPNVPWDLLDASLRFKQALGRLVRRDGLPSNRRIYILDARMGDSAQKGRLIPFVKALSKYRQFVYQDTTYCNTSRSPHGESGGCADHP